ncbi:MAG TPA: hypothetical protein ENN65_02815 [Candidatus Hydrogenedentes bacterium]|nr:hypothetical protein [Candidatus Hydrogenedentota bacterium]
MTTLLEYVRESGVRMAPWRVVADLREAERAAQDLGAPMWVRSTGNEHGFCMRVDHAGDLPLAYAKARQRGGAADALLLLQQAADGAVCRVVGFQFDLTYVPIDAMEESYLEGFYRVPMMLAAPSGLDAGAYAETMEAARKATRTLPPAAGLLEMAFALDTRGPMLLEAYRRDATDPFHTRLLRLALGVDLEAEAARVAAGKPPIAAPMRDMAAVIRWITPSAGVVKAIEGADAARAMPGVEEVTINIRPGDVIRHLTDTAARDRIGWVITVGPTRDIAHACARDAVAAVRIVTQSVT